MKIKPYIHTEGNNMLPAYIGPTLPGGVCQTTPPSRASVGGIPSRRQCAADGGRGRCGILSLWPGGHRLIRYAFFECSLVIIIASLLLLTACEPSGLPPVSGHQPPASIFPDYAGITLPPNIAPVNFKIEEKGEKYLVSISGEKGVPIIIRQASPGIRIPEKKWKALLAENKGGTLSIDIFCYNNKEWHGYETIRNPIADDPIDPYLYYRDIIPTNSLWNQMAMHQRDMETFREYEVFNNYRIDRNCMNCHTFNRNNPREMLFHVRGNNGGTVIYKDGTLRKTSFRTTQALSHGAYCNWHPSGRLVAFAVNNIKQNYYLSGYSDKMKEVYDIESSIVLFDVDKNEVFSPPALDTGMRVNLPAWSADGKRLYFVVAPPYIAGQPNEQVRYSLMQADFDMDTRTVGAPQLMLSADTIGGSISFPTTSPDGKYMLFCVADFGYFPVNNKSADLWLMNLQTGEYATPGINSPESESYISWSSNSRWFVFSSRRLDGMASKPFICHIDEAGRVSKPFILPQKDPDYYRIDRRNFSRPELIREKMPLSFGDLSEPIFAPPQEAQYINRIKHGGTEDTEPLYK